MSPSIAPYITLTDTEDGMVLLDERRGRYLQVNETGAEVLRVLRAGGTPESAVSALCDRHPDHAAHIPADVEDLLTALRTAQVVEP